MFVEVARAWDSSDLIGGSGDNGFEISPTQLLNVVARF
jgi:hypothetical protein